MNASVFPLFLRLEGRPVVVVGGGRMAAARVEQLADAGALVTVVAPDVRPEIEARAATVRRRPFVPADLDGQWLAVAAATPVVNYAVAAAAEERRLFLNAVDDPASATAYTGGVLRRGDATVAVSTGGRAPALAGLLREALEAVLPTDLASWVDLGAGHRASWKRRRLPMAARRPELLDALNAIYAHRNRGTPHAPAGFVSLVGAGPGDPQLLTRRAAQLLGQADLVLYDALVDPAVLQLAPRARCFCIGKRAGKPSVSQRAIERLLVRAARRGSRVVRLKCGDPFVFGRGGEEALALSAAGVPYEVVPGVSSAVAAPTLAGIPVTHRGLTGGFAVVSGHSEAAYGPLVDALAPGSMTLVVLMGLGERPRLASRLLARGWAAQTPAAIVLGASSEDAWTWRGTISGLGAAELPADRERLPGTLVVGPVAALSLAALHPAEPSPVPLHSDERSA